MAQGPTRPHIGADPTGPLTDADVGGSATPSVDYVSTLAASYTWLGLLRD